MPNLDFDGDYGRTYCTSIRDSVPGYDVLHEIATAAVHCVAIPVRRVLVVGPGPGDELVPLLSAFAEAEVVVVEPSGQMLEACKHKIASLPGVERCRFLHASLTEARSGELDGAHFDLVLCHNVLHLMASAEQTAMLRELADVTTCGGTLLLSGYSEPEAPTDYQRMLAVASQRLVDRGMSKDTVAALLATRNRLVFSVDDKSVRTVLTQEGLDTPVLLYQGLFAHLWLCQRP